MSLINIGPSTKPPDRVVEPVKPTQYKPVVIDNRETGQDNLRQFVEGIPITINYYQQLNDNITGTYGYDKEKSPLLQQFVRINNLEVRLDGEITPTQNPQDKTFTLRGEMIVTTGVVPNEGDLFTYETGDGRLGVWHINNTTRMTAVNNSVYQCSFQALFYGTDPQFSDLEAKVVDNLYYLKDYGQFGASAVVTSGTMDNLKALYKLQAEMADDFQREFFDAEHHFLAVPHQEGGVTYDPFATEAFRCMLDPRRRTSHDRIRYYKFSLDEFRSQYTVWDVLLQRRKELLIGCRNKSESTGLGPLSREPMSRSIRYCGADRLVLPSSDTDPDSFYKNSTSEYAPGDGKAPQGPAHLMIPFPIQGEASNLPMLHTPCKDGFYVLSKAFYNKDEAGFSLLEKLLWDYLENKKVNIDHVRHIASNFRAWPSVRRFYYVPIVLLLIQICMQNAGPPVYGQK